MCSLGLLLSLLLWSKLSSADVEDDARKYLERINKLYLEKNYEVTLAEWEYASNITDENLAKKVIIFIDNHYTYKPRHGRIVCT